MKQTGVVILAVRVMETSGRYLAICSGAVSAVLFAAMAFVTLLGVFFRFVIRDPLQWTEEMAIFLMLWAGFLAMNVAMHHRKHISIDLAVQALPNWLSKFLAYVCDLLICYFLIVLTSKGYSMSAKTLMTASSMKFSMSWIYAAVPLGAFLTLMQTVLIAGIRMVQDVAALFDPSPAPTKDKR